MNQSGSQKIADLAGINPLCINGSFLLVLYLACVSNQSAYLQSDLSLSFLPEEMSDPWLPISRAPIKD